MEHTRRNKIVDLLKSKEYGSEVLVKGWVRTKRGNKNINFIALNDGSVIHHIQVVAEVTNFSEDMLKLVTTGSCIAVKGILVESMGQGQSVEIQASQIEVYGTADPETYPLQKKGAQPGIFAGNSPSAAPHQHFWRCVAYSSCHGLCHS